MQHAGIRLASVVKAGGDGKAIATITIENRGDAPVKLFSQELALTLLTKRDGTRTEGIRCLETAARLLSFPAKALKAGMNPGGNIRGLLMRGPSARRTLCLTISPSPRRRRGRLTCHWISLMESMISFAATAAAFTRASVWPAIFPPSTSTMGRRRS